MIRLAFFAALLATPAHAHLGHLGEVAGHGHWIGLGALAGAAILAGLLGKGKKAEPEADDADAPEADGEECPAGCEA